MKSKIQTVKIVLFAAALCLCLSACGSKTTPAASSRAPAAESTEQSASESEPTPEPTPEPTANSAAPDIEVTVPDSEPAAPDAEATAPDTAADSGIRPEFKETMDSYELFFDSYIALMQRYQDNPSDLSILTEYTAYMQQYTDVMEKLDAIGEEDLTDAELLYYSEVMSRISQKLLAAAQ